MKPNENNRPSQSGGMPLAETGNASNPSPQAVETTPLSDNALLAAGAEKYLREGSNIEDLPDAEDQQEAERTAGDSEQK